MSRPISMPLSFRATRLVRPDFPRDASIHTGLLLIACVVSTVYGITADDRQLVAAPLFHEAPTLFALCQLFCGGTVIVTSDTTPANVFGMIDRYKATWAFMVPTMWAAMMTSEEINTSRVGTWSSSPLLTHIDLFIPRRRPQQYGGRRSGAGFESRSVRSATQGEYGRPVVGMFVSCATNTARPSRKAARFISAAPRSSESISTIRRRQPAPAAAASSRSATWGNSMKRDTSRRLKSPQERHDHRLRTSTRTTSRMSCTSIPR